MPSQPHSSWCDDGVIHVGHPSCVQQSGALAGKNVPPKCATCMHGSCRECTWVHICCRDVPRAAPPALLLLAAGQGAARGDLQSLPCPLLLIRELQLHPNAHLNPTLVPCARLGLATCVDHHERWKLVTVHARNTAWTRHQQQIIPPEALRASDHAQATLKTQSDASAVDANLPKICSGNCLHRRRNKVWIFEYANIILQARTRDGC